MKELTDLEVLQGIQSNDPSGNQSAVRFLYDRHYKMIAQMVMQSGGSQDDAEDVFQDLMVVFIENVWRKNFEIEATTKLSTYLYAVARNLWFKRFKSQSARAYREDVFSRTSPIYEDQTDFDTAFKKRIFEKLPSSCQQLLHLFYVDGASIETISSTLGISQGAAKVQKHRCIGSLIKLMKKEGLDNFD